MKEEIGAIILSALIRFGFIKMGEGGRIVWLNEAWSTNGFGFETPRSDRRAYIQLPPGY